MAIFTAIGAAVTTALGGTLIASIVGGAVAIGLQVAVGVGVSMLAQQLTGGGKKNPGFGVQGQLQGGGDVSRSILFGYSATAGSLVYAQEWGELDGTPNAYTTRVIALADMPIKALAEVWVDAEKVTLDATAHPSYGKPALEYRKDGDDFLWVKFYDGTQTVADSFLTGTVSNVDHPYESSRVGYGMPYVIITALINEDLFQSGFPDFKFATTGMRLYDISKDSTRGGSGTHRADTPSTWGGDGDDLVAVQTFALLMGIRYGAAWLYGLQNLPLARLPQADWIAAIAACRGTVPAISGPDEPQYRAGSEIPLNAPLYGAIEALMTAGSGRLSESGGTYVPLFGAPPAASFAIDDGDILSTEAQSFTPFLGIAETINGVVGRWYDPELGWNRRPTYLYSDDLETEDGNRRMMADVSFDMVPYAGQVQRLIASGLAEARRARRHNFVLPPKFYAALPGDTFTWNSYRNGYSSKLMRIDGVGDGSNLDIVVDVTEVSPDDYDPPDYVIPEPSAPANQRPPVQGIPNFAVAGSAMLDTDGNTRRPVIIVEVDPGLQDIASVRVQTRIAGTLTWVLDELHPYDPLNPTIVLVGAGVLPDTLYEVRAKYVPRSDRETEWTLPEDALTPDIRLGPLDIFNIEMAALGEDVRQNLVWLSQSIKQVRNDLQSVALRATDVSNTAHMELRQYIQSITATLVDPETGLVATAEALLALQAIVEDQGDDLTAQALAILAVESSVGEVSASGVFRAESYASPGGGWSRVGLEARASIGDVYAVAAILLDAKSTGESRVVVVADTFAVTDGTTTGFPFVISAGKIAFTGDVVINGSLVVTGTISTPKIAANAVTDGSFYQLASPFQYSTTTLFNTEKTAFTATIPSTYSGAQIVLILNGSYGAHQFGDSQSNGEVTLRIKVAGSTVATFTGTYDEDGSKFDDEYFTYMTSVTGTGSNIVVTVTLQFTSLVGGHYLDMKTVSMMALTLKR